MPKPTLENRNHFKQYLRHFKKKFDSDIQSLNLEHIRDMLGQEDTTLPDNTPVKVVLFDNNGTVDISSAVSNNDYIYFPALAGDRLRVQFSSNSYDFIFEGDEDGFVYNDTTYALNDRLILDGKEFTVKGLGGVLLETEDSPTYTLTPNTTSVNEGDTITFTLTTTNVTDGTYINYAAVTSNVQTEDFSSSTPISGSIIVNNNTATFNLTIVEDYSVQGTEGTETFIVNLTDPNDNTLLGSSPTITITDSSFATYSIAGATTAAENDTVTYTVTTTNVPDGLFLYWRITSGSTSGVSASSGNFVVNNNTGTFSISFPQDLKNDGDNVITIEVSPNNQYTIIVASISTTISDTPFTITLTPNATSVNESSATQDSTVVFNVQTTGIPDGQVLSARIAGGPELTFGGTGAVWTDYSGPPGIDGGDFPSQSGSSTINSDSGVLTVPINRDGRTEGNETFRIEIVNSEGTVVATSPDIVINDTSYIGLNKDNRTFGPIHVVRDNGNANNTSDWYNICGLDAIPNNSKVAIFIDGSGSMTMGTVQASYNKLSEKLTERGITFITVTNGSEDWITPFDVELD